MWLGPVAKQPYHENLVHYNWHWFWDFGNGEIGNQGSPPDGYRPVGRSQLQPGRIGPDSVVSLGGRYGYEDQGQTPNTQLTVFDYGDVKLIFEDYGLVDDNHPKKVDQRVLHHRGSHQERQILPERKIGRENRSRNSNRLCTVAKYFRKLHQLCSQSDRRMKLNAEVLEGHLSSLHCHLGNISYQSWKAGRLLEKAPESFLRGHGFATAAFEKMKDQLSAAIDDDLSGKQYQVGRVISSTTSQEREDHWGSRSGRHDGPRFSRAIHAFQSRSSRLTVGGASLPRIACPGFAARCRSHGGRAPTAERLPRRRDSHSGEAPTAERLPRRRGSCGGDEAMAGIVPRRAEDVRVES